MAIPSSSFSLQVHSSEEVEEWLLVIVRALRDKAPEWEVKVMQDGEGEISFECDPPLTNAEISAAFLKGQR